jgi:hypothetical protein
MGARVDEAGSLENCCVDSATSLRPRDLGQPVSRACHQLAKDSAPRGTARQAQPAEAGVPLTSSVTDPGKATALDPVELGRLAGILAGDAQVQQVVAAWPQVGEGRREAIATLTKRDRGVE